MRKTKIVVFGGGHLGTIHAKLVQQVPDAELVAIVEPSTTRAGELREQFDCDVLTDVSQAATSAAIDGAVVAAPTTLHHEVGTALLSRGVHCLIEKPLASDSPQCDDLVSIAQRNQCVLQVGHVERFNPTWVETCKQLGQPRYIDAVREGSLTFRSMDAGVVLDLMIHDIDLVLSLVGAPVVSVQAMGFHWTGRAEDIAQARLTFSNGCVAKLSASRVATAPRRQMRVYGGDWYGDIDLGDRKASVVQMSSDEDWQTRAYTLEERQHLMGALYQEVLTQEQIEIPEANPILDELVDFVGSIREGRQPVVTGDDGAAAVDIAQQIIQRIDSRVPAIRAFPGRSRKAG